ncbi:MAG: hypothetical protein OHK0046_50230 [Anaerolineae bacterium]
MSYLIMRRGPEPGKIYPFVKDEITVGRGTRNDVIIDDNEVSREHLRFVKVMGGYELYDLSTNGTFVNGQNVEGVWLLRSRCIIELGDSITFEYRPGDPSLDGLDENDTPFTGKYYLVVRVNEQDNATIYPLDDDVIGVGRSTANDIVIVEPELSRNHFRLRRTARGYTIEDLGSTNGTVVNGEMISGPRLLYTDDVISVGTMVQFQITNSAENFVLPKTGPLGTEGATAPLTTRRTSPTDMAGLDEVMQEPMLPTGMGTGVDPVTLRDQIFVTYAREDWETVVAPLVHSLYEAKIGVWVDQYLIEGSNDWFVAVQQARLECYLLVVVVSPRALESDAVQKNWRHFHNREKPILLLIQEAVDKLPIGASKLARIQYNPALPDVAFNQLIAEIKRHTPG